MITIKYSTLKNSFSFLLYISIFTSLLLFVLGGIVRVTGSGLGCPDWPLCYGQLFPPLELKAIIEYTHRFVAMIFGIFVGATAFSYIFRSLGGDDLIHHFVEAMGLGSWGILFLLMGMCFLLGFFFDWVEITLIVVPLFFAFIATLEFGSHIDKAMVVPWVAVLIAVNLQTSFLTPPFGFALFYLKGVAPKNIKIQMIYKGIIPFVLLQLVGLTAIILFPELVMWLPNALLD